MSEVQPDPVDALLDCDEAFEALGAARPGDDALLDRVVVGATAGPGPGGGGTTASGVAPSTWLMIVAAAVVVVAVTLWPRGENKPDGETLATAVNGPTDAAAPQEPLEPSPEPLAPVPAPEEPLEPSEPSEPIEPSESAEPPAEIEPPPKPTRPKLSAAELLEQANRARRASDGRRALSLYERLFREYPRSREAATARVSAGRLQLDRGKPRAALAHFDAYLAGNAGGSLAEEAAVGRALALKALGRKAAELAAWKTLLETHPTTVHAARAETRITALSERAAQPANVEP